MGKTSGHMQSSAEGRTEWSGQKLQHFGLDIELQKYLGCHASHLVLAPSEIDVFQQSLPVPNTCVSGRLAKLTTLNAELSCPGAFALGVNLPTWV